MPASERVRRLWLALLFPVSPAIADESLTVAVASNFHREAQYIAERFTRSTGVEVRLSSGATGALYARIVNGAPYDVFLAADEERPRLLVERGLVLDDERHTYAIGRLHLLAANEAIGEAACKDGILGSGFRKLAIANPETAPYGRAAREYLQNAGIWDEVEPRIVYGENVAQVRQFVETGNAQLGLGARPQVDEPGRMHDVCIRLPQRSLYSPIRQQVVILSRTEMPDAAKLFTGYLLDPGIETYIAESGYAAPEE